MHARRKERFMELYRPLQGRLSRFAQGMTGSHEEARDLVHDAVLVAFEQFDTIKDDKAFLCYLFTVASRLYRKRQRRMRWFGSYDEEQAERMRDGSRSPEVSADVALLHDALRRIPDAQRESVVLFEISGLSLEEIRQIQGGTLSGVKSRVTRGRQKLAEILGADNRGRPELAGETSRTAIPKSETRSIIFSNAQTK